MSKEFLSFTLIAYEKEKDFSKYNIKYLWLWEWYILTLFDENSNKADTIILDKSEFKLLEFLIKLK